jgi:hypothetical protein
MPQKPWCGHATCNMLLLLLLLLQSATGWKAGWISFTKASEGAQTAHLCK